MVKQTNQQRPKTGRQIVSGTKRMIPIVQIPLVQIMNKTLKMDSEEAEVLFDLSLDAFNSLAYLGMIKIWKGV
jgi:hypothetical protein